MNIPIQLVYVPPTKKPGKFRAFVFSAVAIFAATGAFAAISLWGKYAISF